MCCYKIIATHQCFENKSLPTVFQFRMTEKKKSARFTDQMNQVLIDSYSKHQVSAIAMTLGHFWNNLLDAFIPNTP